MNSKEYGSVTPGALFGNNDRPTDRRSEGHRKVNNICIMSVVKLCLNSSLSESLGLDECLPEQEDHAAEYYSYDLSSSHPPQPETSET